MHRLIAALLLFSTVGAFTQSRSCTGPQFRQTTLLFGTETGQGVLGTTNGFTALFTTIDTTGGDSTEYWLLYENGPNLQIQWAHGLKVESDIQDGKVVRQGSDFTAAGTTSDGAIVVASHNGGESTVYDFRIEGESDLTLIDLEADSATVYGLAKNSNGQHMMMSWGSGGSGFTVVGLGDNIVARDLSLSASGEFWLAGSSGENAAFWQLAPDMQSISGWTISAENINGLNAIASRYGHVYFSGGEQLGDSLTAAVVMRWNPDAESIDWGHTFLTEFWNEGIGIEVVQDLVSVVVREGSDQNEGDMMAIAGLSRTSGYPQWINHFAQNAFQIDVTAGPQSVAEGMDRAWLTTGKGYLGGNEVGTIISFASCGNQKCTPPDSLITLSRTYGVNSVESAIVESSLAKQSAELEVIDHSDAVRNICGCGGSSSPPPPGENSSTSVTGETECGITPAWQAEGRCKGDSVKFYNTSTITGQGAVASWEFGDGSTSDEFSPGHVYDTTGTFLVTLYMETLDGECQATAYTELNIVEGVEPSIDTLSYCPEFTPEFDSTDYTISTLDSIPFSNWHPDSSGTKFFMINNACGTYVDTALVLMQDSLEALPEDTLLCHDEPMDLSLPDAYLLQWYPPSAVVDNDTNITQLAANSEVDIMAVYGPPMCPDTQRMHVNVLPPEPPNDPLNFDVFYEEWFNPVAEWSYSDSLLDYHPSFTAISDTTLMLAYADENGCIDSTRMNIDIEHSLFIPNAFTPNGDGLNEIFRPQGTEVVDFEMVVFNRQGQTVFKSNNLKKGWNGRLDNSGPPCQPNLYTYVIRVRYDRFTAEEKHGTVMLIR